MYRWARTLAAAGSPTRLPPGFCSHARLPNCKDCPRRCRAGRTWSLTPEEFKAKGTAVNETYLQYKSILGDVAKHNMEHKGVTALMLDAKRSVGIEIVVKG
ncbi:hypothetical protein WJX73_008859 [Symbiochloris irregularis]|uniref:Uncharacterized protein n=1 Tax=Symbiochloris irregularis TaxID=706552 RepID=A0AAW1NZR8_9CHLO